MRIARRAERIEPFYVMEVAKAASELARAVAHSDRPMIFLNIGEPDFTAPPLVREAAELDALIVPQLDRKLEEISPIEHAVMWIGAYEFQHCADVPWRVVLNECIELAKEFGGTDGHKYVNAVLNGLAPRLRAPEVEADKAAGKAR